MKRQSRTRRARAALLRERRLIAIYRELWKDGQLDASVFKAAMRTAQRRVKIRFGPVLRAAGVAS